MKLFRLLTFLIVTLLFASCGKRTVREKALEYYAHYEWEGPVSQAFESFVLSYYRVPKSTEEMIAFIQEVVNTSPEYVLFGEAKYVMEELKKHPDHFESYSDSCFFYTSRHSGMREGIKVYSPQHVIDNLWSFTSEERYLFESSLCPAFFDEKGLCILDNLAIELRKKHEEGMKEILQNYCLHYVRKDINPPSTLRTVFHYDKKSGLSYYKINVSPSEINIYNRQNKQLLKISEWDDLPLENYLESIKDYLDCFTNNHPRVHEVIFYGPLCFNQ